MKNIPLAKPILGRGELRSLKRVLKSGNLAQGPEVAAFEIEFGALIEAENVVALNSGTSALHVALLSLGIGPGDEVIVPSFTFAATANVVALCGAIPIFVDIESSTMNIDPSKIIDKINSRTKAIIAVHLFGLPANMKEIVKIARSKNLYVIEDAAQAHLAKIGDEFIGTFGDISTFSFYPTKNMTTGEGGVLVARDPAIARIAKLLRNQGMEKRYHNEIVGFNLRMSDLHAAIGRVQLRRIKKWTEKRIEIAEFYRSKLPDRYVQYVPENFKCVYHQFTLKIPKNRDLFESNLTDLGIGCGVYYPIPVHKLKPFVLSESHLPITDRVASEVLSIPVHPSLTFAQQKQVINAVIDGYEKFV
jgi:perosamine synthetase